jgi:lipopolysaccharide/colanic/teichoic acid biosynthesis glycosyltransferase
LLVISIAIKLESKGSIFYKQIRVGKQNKDFILLKFRSMYLNSEQKGQLTIGKKDPRITGIGYILRKYKIDELPQLINVLTGEMSIVGPRPEVRKYVDLYTPEQLKVLSVKPGITDYASIKYIDENKLLSMSDNPEKLYIDVIMNEKIELNLNYINKRNLIHYLRIIALTLKKILQTRNES